MSFTCDDCEKFNENCGCHFIDWNGKIRWNIPSESMYDSVVGDIPSCFEPSENYLKKQREKTLIPLSVIDEIKAEIIEMRKRDPLYYYVSTEDILDWVLNTIDRKVKEHGL